MNILNTTTNFVYTKSPMTHSELMTFFTKYGKFKIKVYKDKQQEYIAIMSKNLLDLERPIVYIHFDVPHYHMDSEMSCYCANQVGLALKMIQKSGGLVIYSSHEAFAIEKLLEDIQSRKLKENSVKDQGQMKFEIKDEVASPSLAYILRDLKVMAVNLITNDAKVIDMVESLGIDILKIESNISFKYGEDSIS